MADRHARVALALAGLLTAAGGVAVNRAGGSGWQQFAVFAVACVFVLAGGVAGVPARWGSSGSGLRLRTADLKGRPRQLGQLELSELGVHRSSASADGYGPYVIREADRDLDDAFDSGQKLVAVAGTMLAGRTRTLAEAARRHLADSWLVWFEETPGAHVGDMVAEARRYARGWPTVLWLENADLALLSQFSGRLLDELPPGFRIVMTLDAGLLDAGVLPDEAAQVLKVPGGCVRLGVITAAERERLAAQRVYAEIARAPDHEPVLMGQLMVSLDQITDALRTPGDDATCRIAVLHAAVDWQRAAVPQPLTRTVIEKLCRDGYWRQMTTRGADAELSPKRFRATLKNLLATAPGDGPPLLEEVYYGNARHLRPSRLLTAVADDPRRPPGWAVSEILWNYLDQALDDPQRMSVGLTACTRGDYRHARRILDPLGPAGVPAEIVFRIADAAREAGEDTAARTWYADASATGHGDWAPRAMYSLGVLEDQQGRIEDARAWYAKAAATGHPDMAPLAMYKLGALEQRQDRLDEARAWWARAIATRHPDQAPAAMYSLGVLEDQQGRIEDARAWYAKAAVTGHPDQAPLAMYSLGVLENKQGRIEDARAWWADAAATGYPGTAPLAMYSLGVLEDEQGRVEDARSWYARAIATGHPDQAPHAMYNLGVLERRQGRIEEARTWWARAIATGQPGTAPTAMYNLGVLENKQGRIEAARDWWARAAATGHTDQAPQAMYNLGVLENKQGRIEAARAWYARAIATGHPDQAPQAMVNLGVLEGQQGRMEKARAWWARAIATRHPDMAPRAMFNLGVLEQRRDHIEDARAWYARAIATGHPEQAPQAMVNLGVLEGQQGRIQEARAWYAMAIATGHPDMAPKATYNLGTLENERGRIEDARAWWARAAATGHPHQAPLAMHNLAALEQQQGRIEDGRDWYARAIATGHPEQAPRAMVNLGVLEGQQGRMEKARGWFARAIATGHPDMAPRAMFNLGVLEQRLDHVEQARDWWAKVIETGHPAVARRAQELRDELQRNQQVFQQADKFKKYGNRFVTADFAQPLAGAESAADSSDDEST
ncbi:MAG TPA: tetratricopeptide repeat protein [Streptosporangiaceae bacterium]|nr:tetratricopeptide repeat protein [Streptosporangiaceae bacterium]